MPSTMPLRVGADLLASAKLAADASGRSAAQQIGYWAKLGRELERSGSVSVREVAEVLAGSASYDDLDPKAQAAVRAEWDARIEARRAALNLAHVFAAEGRSWVEAGPEGTTVRHPASGSGAPPKRGRRVAATTKAAQSRTTERAAKSKATAAVKQTLPKKAATKKASARSR